MRLKACFIYYMYENQNIDFLCDLSETEFQITVRNICKINKRKKVVIDNLANFLSISPNQTKFFPITSLKIQAQ